MNSVSGRLEPIHFTITAEGDKQTVTLLALKSGHTYSRDFGPDESVKDMLAKVKSDLFSV